MYFLDFNNGLIAQWFYKPQTSTNYTTQTITLLVSYNVPCCLLVTTPRTTLAGNSYDYGVLEISSATIITAGNGYYVFCIGY